MSPPGEGASGGEGAGLTSPPGGESAGLGGMRRTHTCGALRAADVGQSVTLMGWAFRRRDHGGLIFIDLRDREGITQLVFNPGVDPAAHEEAGRVRAEFVLAVEGTVQARPSGWGAPRLRS